MNAMHSLYWDGEQLQGEARGGVTVLVPARLVAFAAFELPAAELAILRSACLLRARRHFAALLPAQLEASICPAMDGRCPLLAMALPATQLQAITVAAKERQLRIKAIRLAEACQPVPADGIVTVAGEAALLCCTSAGALRDVQVLGPVADPAFSERCRQAQLAVGDCHAADPPGLALDFLHPGLEQRQTMWARPQLRVGALVALLLVLILGGFGLSFLDLLREHQELAARLDRLGLQAEELQAKRREMRELAGWFDDRPSPEAALSALTAALAIRNGAAQIYLTRFRQHDGRRHSAEGVALNRDAMMAYVERLRRQAGVSQVEIRNLSGGGKDGGRLSFELSLEMGGDADADA